MRLLLVFLATLVLSSLFAQNFSSADPAYKTAVQAGEKALLSGDYSECLTQYATGFKIKQTSFLSTLRAAACAHADDKMKLRDQYLDKAFELGPDRVNGIFQNYEEFEFLRQGEFADLMKARYLAAFPDIDPVLQDRLAAVIASDQEQRQHMRTISDKYGWQSPQMDSLWKLQSFSDSVNTIYITELIDERGYPGKSLVGDQASTAFLVIQHAELAVQEKYLPILRTAAEAGELRWSSLALLIDRVEMRNDRPQVYGSQVSRNEESGEHFFSPIADPYRIDSIRSSVGLGPIQEYADRWNFTFNPEVHLARKKRKN